MQKLEFKDTPETKKESLVEKTEASASAPISSKPETKLIRNIDMSSKKKSGVNPLIISLIVVLLGVGSGYGLSQATAGSTSLAPASETRTTQDIATTGVKVGDVVGSDDTSTFSDDVVGVLVKGGVEGEGSHHIMRPGGKTQNVYITSSVVDLSLFEGHKVEVWGETYSAQKAGWLMDVGRVKVLELNAEKPFEE